MPTSPRSPLIGELTERFGLPRYCTEFVITARLNEPVTVQCTFYPDVKSAALVTKQYKLTEVE